MAASAGIELRGESARLCWSYHVAADLGKWLIFTKKKSTELRLHAVIASSDPFQMTQSPLIFEGAGLRYQLSDVEIKNGRIEARLSKVEG
jgi:hypothetical protein